MEPLTQEQLRKSLSVVLAVIMGLLTSYALLTQFRLPLVPLRPRTAALEERIEEVKQTIQEQVRFQQQLQAVLNKAPERVETAAVTQKLKELEDKISAVQNQTLGLRQAINPSKPEEILTIARLTDELRILRKDSETFRNAITSLRNRNYSRIPSYAR